MLMRAALLVKTATAVVGLLVVAIGANVLVEVDATGARLGALAAVLPAIAITWLSYRKNAPVLPIWAPEADTKAAVRQIAADVDLVLANRSLNNKLQVPVVMYDGQEFRQAIDSQGRFPSRAPSSWDAMVALFNEDPRCTLVVGPSGSGKTTVLYTLARELLHDAKIETKSYVPLPLSLATWSPECGSFRTWVTRRSRIQLRIPAFVTATWLRRGSAILFLDGLDELTPSSQQSFMTEIGDWTRSAKGTRVVMACRIETARLAVTRLQIESVAALQPLSTTTMRSYISDSLSLDSVSVSERANAVRLFDLVKPNEQLYDDLRRPSFLELLVRSFTQKLTAPEFGTPDDRDPGFVAFRAANQLAANDDIQGAHETYLKIMDTRRSRWRAPAAIRLSLLLHRSNRTDEARTALLKAVTYSLEPSFAPGGSSWDAEVLTPDEQQVLASMSTGRSYDEAQVSSSALLPPSGSTKAIRSLRLKGLVDVVDDGRGNARFARR
ncbi:NACHT domain-containing protein [Plantactinospora sp. S1510]|uniref:NACHT domain-containing protein n=1 Tax=Plantactinospora alkalitolerans TaxID=2789879 RepID=A0ABS0H8Y9_9ACTN|nr:NACHT domain-containing protein [Plantactinospora alkalitolerans]